MHVLTAADAVELAGLRSHDDFFWLDLRDPTPADVEAMGTELGLHPLALEDTHEWRQRPKLETYDDYVFMVFYSVSSAESGHVDRSMEVHVYVSSFFIVTVRRGECAHIDLLRGRLDPSADAAEEYLVYRILDELTDAFFPLVAATEARIDLLEAQVLDRTRHEQLETIYRLKQEIQRFERLVIAQQRYFPAAVDAIMALPGLSRGARPYLREIGDHLTHVAEELHRQHSDLAGLTETFYNANTNKLNVTATRLSVVATLFLVATMITGFFGQNFGWLVAGIDSRSDFLVFGLGGLLAPLGILGVYLWHRRDDWM
jgi:magnesium transporter